MNTRFRVDVSGLLAILGAVVSIVGLVFALGNMFHIRQLFLESLFSVAAGMLVGIASSYLADRARKLTRARRIFLSYPSQESSLAHEVADTLRKAGARVWVDVERIEPGQSVSDVIEKAIRDADTFVALLSRKPSPNLMFELGLAKARGLRVIPVLIESAEVPSDLVNLRYIDLTTNRGRGLEQLVQVIK